MRIRKKSRDSFVFILVVVLMLVWTAALAADSIHPVECLVQGVEVNTSQSVLWDGSDLFLPLDSLKFFQVDFHINKGDDSITINLPDKSQADIPLAKPTREFMVPMSALAKYIHATYSVANNVCTVTLFNPTGANVNTQSPMNVQGSVSGSYSIGSPSPPKSPANTSGTNTAPPVATTGETMAPPVVPPGDSIIQNVQWVTNDSHHAQIIISMNRPVPLPKVIFSPDMNSLEINIPKSIAQTSTNQWTIDHPFATSMSFSSLPNSDTAQLQVQLKQTVAYGEYRDANNNIIVNLFSPRRSGIPMNQLRIIVDPGHGGIDTGCHAFVAGHSIDEKTLTLQIAKLLNQDLINYDATTWMTRTTDTYVGLYERPALESKYNADLFVSIHIDDCPGNDHASGTSVYYHMNDASSRALAISIANSVAKVSGLPERGALSDSILYHTGLAVLRKSVVPAVLVEVGYINNPKDRTKLLNPKVQTIVAQAICDGIRNYVEGPLHTTPSGASDVADNDVTLKDTAK